MDTNIDIVNPMPARMVTPMKTIQFTFVASRTILNLVRIYTANEIPRGFPTNKPNIIPNEMGGRSPSIEVEEIIMLVLAGAKIGMMMKLTGKLSRFSNAGILLIGRMKASITPAKVACIPDL